MFKSRILLLFLVIIFLVNTACDTENSVRISGNIDYIGDADFYIQKAPLHYKYSPKETYPISVDGQQFEIDIPIIESQIIQLYIQDSSYPLYVEPGDVFTLDISRSEFPDRVMIEENDSDWNDAYITFREKTEGLQASLDAEMDRFKVGEPNEALMLSSEKLIIAQNTLKGTKLHPLFLKTIGEDLVIKLRAVEYSDRHDPNFPTESERQDVIDEALEKDFFSLESLEAQRAGIRDFTHYYSRTFGIYDSVVAEFGEPLAEYDIKQLAYEELNDKRMQILSYIEGEQAKAYAEMFLVAERIGEQPLEISNPTYEEYLNTYPQYNKYTDFLTYFYNEIKSVSPGQPAVPFELPDIDGEVHTLDEYSGKYVLLDFWAGWCQPCLDEFEDMRRIYEKYSRDDLEILGISTEVDSTVWVYDIQRFENPWLQLYGGNGFEQETFKAYKGGGIPFYILVDREGNIERYNDFRPSFNFEEVFDNILENESN